MNSWQDSFKAGMDLIPALVFLGLNSMIRPIVAPELEKRLGRKLTDWEWEYYLQESYRKAKSESQLQIIRQWRRRLTDMQIIHDFVWGECEAKSV